MGSEEIVRLWIKSTDCILHHLLGERLDTIGDDEDLCDLLNDDGIEDLNDLDFDMDETIMDADMSSIIKVKGKVSLNAKHLFSLSIQSSYPQLLIRLYLYIYLFIYQSINQSNFRSIYLIYLSINKTICIYFYIFKLSSFPLQPFHIC